MPGLSHYTKGLNPAICGLADGIFITYWQSPDERSNWGMTLALEDTEAVSAHESWIATNLLRENAMCSKCKTAANGLFFLEFLHQCEKLLYAACGCGCPLWRSKVDDLYYALNQRLIWRERSRLRQQKIAAAGGNHTAKEIVGLMTIQCGRCIYCNRAFDQTCTPTRDHLLPVAWGGDHSAFNLVLACRSCNSRRCAIPFRTYCRLLSPSQNQRILRYLIRRVRIDIDTEATEEKRLIFAAALELHDRYDERFLLIRRTSPTANKNAIANKLLPTYPQILRIIIASLKKR